MPIFDAFVSYLIANFVISTAPTNKNHSLRYQNRLLPHMFGFKKHLKFRSFRCFYLQIALMVILPFCAILMLNSFSLQYFTQIPISVDNFTF